MEKINGYTQEEAQGLIEYVEEGRRRGKTLTSLFASYGQEHGRAKGSVRNYYYALMKNERGDERIVKLLDGRQLTVGKIRAFSEEEADEAIRSILLECAKGVSVRRAIFNLSGGDDKRMLRLQNKYRNTLKKEPQKIIEMERALFGKSTLQTRKKQKQGGRDVLNDERMAKALRSDDGRALLQRRLEREINALYDRLTSALKAENLRLLEENQALKMQIEQLRARQS